MAAADFCARLNARRRTSDTDARMRAKVKDHNSSMGSHLLSDLTEIRIDTPERQDRHRNTW